MEGIKKLDAINELSRIAKLLNGDIVITGITKSKLNSDADCLSFMRWLVANSKVIYDIDDQYWYTFSGNFFGKDIYASHDFKYPYTQIDFIVKIQGLIDEVESKTKTKGKN